MSARPRTAQEFIHWLEAGKGARWILFAALIVCGFSLSIRVAWVQFHGAPTESTLEQADMARQIATGGGFTTQVIYPQAMDYLRTRGIRFDAATPYPEVYQAPFYPMVIAGPMWVFIHIWPKALFAPAPAPPDGYAGDYFLLAVNLVLFWLAIWLAFDLARRLFGVPSGWLAALALFVSLAAWQQVVAVNGTALMMVLALGAFHAWWRVESAEGPGRASVPLFVLGALCGALFLTEYSAGALLAVAMWGVGRRFGAPGRWRALGILSAGFILVAGPWITRNLLVTGSPVGLAIQNIALKSGDLTAEPSTVRATLSAKLPDIELNKLGNKALTSIQENLGTRVWAGGAMWFLAFFVTGWLYVFRSGPVNRLRWMFVVSLLVLVASQSVFNSGDSERQVVVWLCPLIIVFGAGFFFVLLGSHPALSSWPRACAAALLILQGAPLVHDVLDPHRLHFQYPPYFPQLFQGMRRELYASDSSGRYGLMADVPAGLAWYGRTRAWAQPATLHDFYEVQVEQPTGELLLTPRTLDRPFFSDLNAQPKVPGFLTAGISRIGEWGEVYGGLLTGSLPRNFPLSAPQKLAENLYVLVNPSLPAAQTR